jgi:prepilin-type N-terminal cleavage/methylation domain-containing protein
MAANPHHVDGGGKLRRSGAAGAFTLMELMTVMVIIGILSVLAVQAFSFMIFRAQRTACTTNLQSLFAAAGSYVNDYQSWPQVSTADISGTTYAQAWITALAPYKIANINWICPSVQRLLGNPDITQPQNVRVDYFATPFDTNPSSPMRYSSQPWFVECANVHGDGNLMICSNGLVQSLNQALEYGSTPPSQ